jgi:hypothetical protein
MLAFGMALAERNLNGSRPIVDGLSRSGLNNGRTWNATFI